MPAGARVAPGRAAGLEGCEVPMESAISATYTAISFMHALKRDSAACLLYLVLAALYLAASHRKHPRG